MIFFPSWLQHAALPTKDEDNRVIFAFNIGVGGGLGDLKSMEWDRDPVAGYSSSFTDPIVHELVPSEDCSLRYEL